jgi:hypothetical protein
VKNAAPAEIVESEQASPKSPVNPRKDKTTTDN